MSHECTVTYPYVHVLNAEEYDVGGWFVFDHVNNPLFLPPLLPPAQQKPAIAPKPQLPPRPQSISPTPPPKPGGADDTGEGARRRPVSLSAAQNAAAAAAAARPQDLPVSQQQQQQGTPGQGSAESPEKLSLKARLKLFEKEIEQQGQVPAKKAGK